MDLVQTLRSLVGPRHVLTGPQTARYGRDWMGYYSAEPLAVVRPASTAEVSAVVGACAAAGAAIVPIGGNTGLVGGTHAPGAVMVSLERMNAIREIRPQARVAIVEAGLVLGKLHEAAERHGLTFPLFFGARGSATIGGNIATNAGGSNVLRYGTTRALVLGLEVVLPDGRVADLMSALHKDNTGYDLRDLFIGSEGTLGIVTAAVLRLVPKPRAHATAMVSVPDLGAALNLLNRLRDATGGMVEGFEFMPRTYMARLRQVLPELVPPLGHDREVTILVELGATAPRDADPGPDGATPVTTLLQEALAGLIEEGLADDAVVANSEAQRMAMWRIREVAAEIIAGRLPAVDTDIALPLDQVAAFYAEVHRRLAALDAGAETITVGHLGDGNLHFTAWPSRDDKAHLDSIRDMVDGLAVEHGGTYSAEHGIGLTKKKSLARLKDPVAQDLMRAIKAAVDPAGIMNPGKILS